MYIPCTLSFFGYDCRVFCVGSKDMNTRVYGAQKFKNLIIYSMGGHTNSIVGSFFDYNSLDVSFLFWESDLFVWY